MHKALNIGGAIAVDPPHLRLHRFPRSTVRMGHGLLRATRSRRGLRAKAPLSKGISLVHIADRQLAVPGEKIIFSTWVINDSHERLEHICLMPRSFTNAGMVNLTYQSQPRVRDLIFGPLLPTAATSFTFSYTASADDQRDGGGLLSAMMVQARSSSGRLLWDECDALVDMNPVDDEAICAEWI